MDHLINFGLLVHVISLFVLYNQEYSIYTYYIGLIVNVLMLLGIVHYRKKIFISHVVLYYSLFAMICFFSIYYSVEPDDSEKRSMLVLFMLFHGICLSTYLDSWELITKMMRYFVCGSNILVLMLLLLQDISMITVSQRFGAGVINENYVGSMTAFGVIFSAYLYRREKAKVWQVFYLISTCMALVGVILSGSRNVYVMVLVAVCANAWFNRGGWVVIIRRFFISFASLFLTYLMIQMIPTLSETIGNRIDSIFGLVFNTEASDGSIEHRLYMIEFGLNIFLDALFLGHGIDSFASLYPIKHAYAHNNFVELIVDVGLIGTVTYYLIPLILWRKLYYYFHTPKVRTEVQLFLVVIVSMVILGIGTVYYDRAFAIDIFVLAMAVVRLSDSDQLKSYQPHSRLT